MNLFSKKSSSGNASSSSSPFSFLSSKKDDKDNKDKDATTAVAPPPALSSSETLNTSVTAKSSSESSTSTSSSASYTSLSVATVTQPGTPTSATTTSTTLSSSLSESISSSKFSTPSNSSVHTNGSPYVSSPSSQTSHSSNISANTTDYSSTKISSSSSTSASNYNLDFRSNTSASKQSTSKKVEPPASKEEVDRLLKSLSFLYQTKNRMLLSQNFINTSDIMQELETVAHEVCTIKDAQADGLGLSSSSSGGDRNSSKKASLRVNSSSRRPSGGHPPSPGSSSQGLRSSYRAASSRSNSVTSPLNRVDSVSREDLFENEFESLTLDSTPGGGELQNKYIVDSSKSNIECSVIEVNFDQEIQNIFLKEEEENREKEERKKREQEKMSSDWVNIGGVEADPYATKGSSSHGPPARSTIDTAALKDGDTWVDKPIQQASLLSSAFMNAKVSWTYSSEKSKSNSSGLNIQDIQKFCFPSGIYINYFTKAKAFESLNNDGKRHVMSFPNAEGGPCYACCLIVNTVAPSASLQMTKILISIVKRQKCAKIILKCIHSYLIQKKKRRWEIPKLTPAASFTTSILASLDGSQHGGSSSQHGGGGGGGSQHGGSNSSAGNSENGTPHGEESTKKSFFDMAFSSSSKDKKDTKDKDEGFFSKVFKRSNKSDVTISAGFHPIDIDNFIGADMESNSKTSSKSISKPMDIIDNFIGGGVEQSSKKVISSNNVDASSSSSSNSDSDSNSNSCINSNKDSNGGESYSDTNNGPPVGKPPRRSISDSDSISVKEIIADLLATNTANLLVDVKECSRKDVHDVDNNSNSNSNNDGSSNAVVESSSSLTENIESIAQETVLLNNNNTTLKATAEHQKESVDDIEVVSILEETPGKSIEHPKMGCNSGDQDCYDDLSSTSSWGKSLSSEVGSTCGSPSDEVIQEEVAEEGEVGEVKTRGRARVLLPDWEVDNREGNGDENEGFDNDDENEEEDDDDGRDGEGMDSFFEGAIGDIIRKKKGSKLASVVVDHDAIIANLQHQKYCILSKKAYCIVTKNRNHSKIFKILEAMAYAERSLLISRLNDGTSSGSNYSNSENLNISVDNLNEDKSTTTSGLEANPVAAAATASSSTTTTVVNDLAFDQFRSTFLESCRSNLTMSLTKSTIDVPGFIDNFELFPDKEYPTMSEWTTAVMMVYLAPDKIKTILKVLLSERSIVIWGKHPGVVSAISNAIYSLMCPFSWEGPFIPIVPDEARDVFEAPFPFIVGTISAPNLSVIGEHVAVLTLDEDLTKLEPSARYTAWFSRLPDINMEIHHEPLFESKLKLYREKVLHGVSRRISSGLDPEISPVDMFLSSMSSIEKKYVEKFSELCANANRQYCGALETHGNWRASAKVVSSELESNTNSAQRVGLVAYQFDASKFLEPLNLQLDFLDVVARTKYFKAYVEKKVLGDACFEANSKEFIHNWLSYRIRMRRSNVKRSKK